MEARVGVVTDSTADLPLDLADDIGLRIVPMTVSFRDQTFISRVTITDDEFYARLRTATTLPTTAQPNPAWFHEAYQDCLDDGLAACVSLHVSRELSGTVAAARRAAEATSLDVRVVDSRQVGGGLALMALAAQRHASEGGSVEDVLAAAERTRAALLSFVVVDTLENLKRGGRLSGAQVLVGNVLQVKPILTVREGRIEPVERARTFSRAMDRIVELVATGLAGRPAEVVVTHALAPDRAEDLWARLRERIEVASELTTVFGPVLGTHTGQGAVAVAAVPTDP